MAELPKQLPGLRKRLGFSIEELTNWRKLARQYQFTDDIQQQIDLFLSCHHAAQFCVDGDLNQAYRATERALTVADLWRTTPSGRANDRNFVHDHYAGIQDDTMNQFYNIAAEIIEEILDWEFTVASDRAAQSGFGSDPANEEREFHAEDAILLCQMQALCACCESILPIYWEQKDVARHKMLVAHHEIAAWKALVVEGTQKY